MDILHTMVGSRVKIVCKLFCVIYNCPFVGLYDNLLNYVKVGIYPLSYSSSIPITM